MEGAMEQFKTVYQYLDEVDLVNQKKIELYHKVINAVFAIIGFILGFVTQKFQYTAICVGIAMVINLVLFVPGWPWLKSNQLNFVPAQNRKNK